jgi:hypothetical protein
MTPAPSLASVLRALRDCVGSDAPSRLAVKGSCESSRSTSGTGRHLAPDGSVRLSWMEVTAEGGRGGVACRGGTAPRVGRRNRPDRRVEHRFDRHLPGDAVKHCPRQVLADLALARSGQGEVDPGPWLRYVTRRALFAPVASTVTAWRALDRVNEIHLTPAGRAGGGGAAPDPVRRVVSRSGCHHRDRPVRQGAGRPHMETHVRFPSSHLVPGPPRRVVG